MRAVFRSEPLQEQFDRLGYVSVPFLNAEEIDDLKRVYGGAPAEVGTGFYTSLWSADVRYRAVIHQEVLRVFSRVVRELFADYRLCLGNFAVKRAGDPQNQVPLHQDWSFVDRARFLALSIWCPLVDVDARNGCLAVVPGSHRFRDEIRPNVEPGQHFFPFAGVEGVLREKHLLEIPTRAGDALVYDGRLLHASRATRLEQDRVVAVGVAIPQEAPLLHYFTVSPTEHEVFEVDEDFYWRHVKLGNRPENARSLGRVRYTREPFTAEELARTTSKAS